jgi:hypothetical protein
MNNAKYGLISNVQRYKKKKKYETFASEKILRNLNIINSIKEQKIALEIIRAIFSILLPSYNRAKTVIGKRIIPNILR